MTYVPRHDLLQWTFLAAATYLFVTYRFARGADRSRLVSALLAQGMLLFAALAVFLAYHVHHAAGPQPEVLFWDSYVRVTPFHEQLAVPGFVGLVLAPLILLVALRAERAAVRPQLF